MATGMSGSGPKAGSAEKRLLYRPVEAAEILGVSRSTVYELMAAGELRSVRIGTLRRIPAQALVDFVERHDLSA